MKSGYLLIACFITTQIISIPILKQPPAPDLDKQNMFNAIYTLPEQLQQAINIAKRINLKHNYNNIRNILFIGVGNENITCKITQTLIEQTCNRPITMVQNYTLPTWADQHTLAICISYSGDTQEIVSCFDQAHEKHIPIIGVCSGGSLLEKLLACDYDHIIIPSGIEPRAALGYIIAPLIYIMRALNCTDDQVINDIQTVPEHLKNYRNLFSVKDGANPTYLFAINTKQYLPVIFGQTNCTSCISQRWAAQFAQNSKMLAHVNTIPDLAYHELSGWKNNPHLLKNCIAIWLTDPSTDVRNTQHMDICKETLQGIPAVQVQFHGAGANLCQRLFYLLYFGDWISYWCALEHATDPT